MSRINCKYSENIVSFKTKQIIQIGDIMINQFSRTEVLFGSEGMEKLIRARVAVFGIGGVGGHAVEALVRSGIGTVDIIDNDTVSLTNINRQIIASHSTIGKFKVDVMKGRLLDINPNVQINKRNCFFTPETACEFDFSDYDYVIDAIDTIPSKIALITESQKVNTPIISSMGAGNKLDPTKFQVADIFETSVCPLARAIRSRLKKLGITKLKVVYSNEIPATPKAEITETKGKGKAPGSNAFVPSVAGLIIAGEVIKDIAEF